MIVVEAFDRMVLKVTSEDMLSSWRIDCSHRDTRVQFVNIIIYLFIFIFFGGCYTRACGRS